MLKTICKNHFLGATGGHMNVENRELIQCPRSARADDHGHPRARAMHRSVRSHAARAHKVTHEGVGHQKTGWEKQIVSRAFWAST